MSFNSSYEAFLPTVQIQYTLDGGDIVEESVTLDVHVESFEVPDTHATIYFYDVVNKWVLALPETYGKISSIDSSKADTWQKVVTKELEHTAKLRELGILNRCSKPCKVTIKYLGKKVAFNSFMCRNIFSLVDEGVYDVVSHSRHSKIVYPVKLFADTTADYLDPKTYDSLMMPLLEDLCILQSGKLTVPLYILPCVIVQEEAVTVVKLLCLGCAVVKYDRKTRNQEIKELVGMVVSELLISEYLEYMRDSYFNTTQKKLDTTKITKYYTDSFKNLDPLDYKSDDPLSYINNYIDPSLTGIEEIVAGTVIERNKQLLAAVSQLNQSKKFIVNLVYAGVSFFYNDGESLVLTVRNGSDYMLRLLTKQRLENLMYYKIMAERLLSSSASSIAMDKGNSYAMEYLLVRDTRDNKEAASSYKQLLHILESLGKNHLARKVYTYYRAPSYRQLENKYR